VCGDHQKQGKVVNNESSEVIRILYSAFDELLPEGSASKGVSYYPAAHAKEIDDVNEWIYDKINNGVYKAGFAGTQEVRERERGGKKRESDFEYSLTSLSR
jgi:putative glutathione S-transferase